VLKERQADVLVGAGALARPDGARCWRWRPSCALDFGVVKDGWNGFNVLHTAAARVGALDLGFVPGEGGPDAPA
jgi:NADH-quinone oxidoreductase subunit G